MSGSLSKLSWLLLPIGWLSFGVSLIAAPVLERQDPQQPDSYSSTTEAHPRPSTPDQPKMTDRVIAQNIRKAIYSDNSLSAQAHHIKIVARGGKVTLEGSVRSAEERSNIFAKAAAVAGDANVTNKIEVTSAKQ